MMTITAPRDSLLAAVKIVAAAVGVRTTMPVLTMIKLIAEGDRLTLMATDNEIGIRYELRGIHAKQSGEAVLPPDKLASILSATADAEITISVGEESSKIRTSTGRYEIPVTDAALFPDIPNVDETSAYHEVTAGVLRTLLKRTAFAAEKRELTRFAVTGVLWEALEKTVRIVATDTRRLAMTEGPAVVHGQPLPDKKDSIIPLRAIQLLERNFSDDSELIKVVLKNNEAYFQTERAVIHTRLVEGRFPPYQNIIPSRATTKLDLPLAGFASAVKQAAIMTDDETRRVEFLFEPGSVTLTSKAAAAGSGEVKLELPDYDGASVKIAFDPNYLSDMFRAVDGEPTTRLEMTDGQRPAVFKIGADYLYLVMPLQ
ncbi:MAG: DNA polymerase III subunit beta [Fimbriiglobus sp.]